VQLTVDPVRASVMAPVTASLTARRRSSRLVDGQVGAHGDGGCQAAGQADACLVRREDEVDGIG
jgi:hypothetical protein